MPFDQLRRCSEIRDFFIREVGFWNSLLHQTITEFVFSLFQLFAVRVMSEASKSQGTCTERLIEETKCLQPLQVDPDNGVSMDILKEDMDELNQRKVTMVKDLQLLRDRVNKAGANVVQNLMSCLKTLEDLGKQESEFLSTCNSKRSKLQDEIIELEGRLTSDGECSNFLDSLDDLISESEEELNSVKKALRSSLRETLALKRLLDDVPTQTELIQSVLLSPSTFPS